MAFHYNPTLVTDGCVYAIDVVNTKSYPGSGTSISSLVGLGLSGILTNGAVYSGSGFTGSIFFDGVNDYVETWNTSLLKSSPFTVSFWVNVNAFGGSYGSNALCQQYTLFGPVASYLGYTNTFMAAIQIASNGNAEGVVRENNFSTNRWYYYVSTYDGSAIGNTERLKVYIDGTQRSLIYDNTIPSSPSLTPSSTLALGYFVASGFNYFNGKIGPVHIYNRALSSSEILQNFNATRGRYGI